MISINLIRADLIQCPIRGIETIDAFRARPVCSEFVTSLPPSLISGKYQPHSPAAITLLPLEWILNPDKGKSFANRVLARLIQLEAHEQDVWLREDIRQSFITLSLALKDYEQPFISASYAMYGLHPDKVWPAILARRKMLLGSEYEEICGGVDTLGRLHGDQLSVSPPVRTTYAEFDSRARKNRERSATAPRLVTGTEDQSAGISSPKKSVQSVKSPIKKEGAA